jgi:ribonuclease BN (tRNA processing enzyme)
MKIEVLGCYGGESPDCRLTCLRINDSIALDAGCLSDGLSIAQQMEVKSLVLTHSHMDHTKGLPFFLDNVFGTDHGGLKVYGSGATIYAIRKYLFNASTWPDFSRLPNHLVPAVSFEEIDEEVPFEIEGVRFIPIAVNHVVPTFGYLIQQGDSAVLWSSDTGATHRLWQVANSTPNLKAVCIDVSFSSDMQQVADDSRHLTPVGLSEELKKLEIDVPIYVHHLKPRFIDAIEKELAFIEGRNIELLEQGRIYDF